MDQFGDIHGYVSWRLDTAINLHFWVMAIQGGNQKFKNIKMNRKQLTMNEVREEIQQDNNFCTVESKIH